MRNNPAISIVVPVYNVENYLDQCIVSILNQSFDNFELLLIDDGSTDRSSSICKEYLKRDNRVRYFYKQNGGLSDARNFGLKHIRGEFVSFIDSDDWVESNYLAYLFNAIQTNRADISTCVYTVCSETGKKPWKNLPVEAKVLSSRDALISMLYSETINVCAHSKLFRSSLFLDVRFPYGKHFEDVGTTYKLIQRSELVAVGGAPLYNYVMRKGSITHSVNPSIFDRAELAKTAYENLNNIDQVIADAAERYYVFHSLSTLHSFDLGDCEQRDKATELRSEILYHGNNILHNKRVPNRDKIAFLALKLGMPFYRMSWNIYAKATGRA